MHLIWRVRKKTFERLEIWINKKSAEVFQRLPIDVCELWRSRQDILSPTTLAMLMIDWRVTIVIYGITLYGQGPQWQLEVFLFHRRYRNEMPTNVHRILHLYTWRWIGVLRWQWPVFYGYYADWCNWLQSWARFWVIDRRLRWWSSHYPCSE